MSQLFANNASTTLNAGINGSVTTIAVSSGHGSLFPAPAGSNYFLATIQENATVEIVKVTARSGDSMTVVRGQEGTAGAAFSPAAVFEMRITSGALALLQSPKLLGVGLTSAIDTNSLVQQIGDATGVNAYSGFFKGTGQLKVFSDNLSDNSTGLAAGISNQMLLTTALDAEGEYTPFYGELHCTDTSSSGAFLYGADLEVFADHASGTIAQVSGLSINAYNNQAGTVTTLSGITAFAGISHSGTSTNVICGDFTAFANPGTVSGNLYGLRGIAELVATSTSGGDVAGVYAQAYHDGSATTSGNIYGIFANAASKTASTGLTSSNDLIAGRFLVQNASGGSAIGVMAGLYVDPIASGGAGAATAYGIYIGDQSGASATAKYAFYYNSSSPTYIDSTGALYVNGVNVTGGGGGGVTTVGAFSGSSHTNGAAISGSTITFGPADGTNPGMVTTGSQTFAGAKTFLGNIFAASNAFQIASSDGSVTMGPSSIAEGAPNSDGIVKSVFSLFNNTTTYNSNPEAGFNVAGLYTSINQAIDWGGIQWGKENGTSGDQRSFARIITRNASTLTEAMRWTSDQHVLIGASADDSTGALLQLAGKVSLAGSYADNSGSPGGTTINNASGRAAIASAAQTCVVTNSLVSATSIVTVNLETTGAGVDGLAVVPGAGSFTVTSMASGVPTNASATCKFSFVVMS